MDNDEIQLTLRPPWPDELPQLKDHIADADRMTGTIRLLVLAASDPDRIVGAGAVAVSPEASDARLFFGVRPRYLLHPMTRRLVIGLTEIVCEEGCPAAHAYMDAGDPRESVLFQCGFASDHAEELWLLGIDKLLERVGRTAKHIYRSGGVTVRHPTPGDLPRIWEMALHYGFAGRDRIILCPPDGDPASGYDAALSSVVEREGRVVAALMGRGSAMSSCAHAEMRMVDPAEMAHSGAYNIMMLEHSCKTGKSMGYTHSTLTINTARDRETANMARRMDGSLLKTVDVAVCNLGSV